MSQPVSQQALNYEELAITLKKKCYERDFSPAYAVSLIEDKLKEFTSNLSLLSKNAKLSEDQRSFLRNLNLLINSIQAKEYEGETGVFVLRFNRSMLDFALSALPYDNPDVYRVIAQLFTPSMFFHYKVGDKIGREPENYASRSNTNFSRYYELLVDQINYFGNRGGFQSMMERVKADTVDMTLLKSVTNVVHATKEYLNESVKNDIIPPLQEFIFKFLMGLEEDRLRDVTKKDVDDCLSQLVNLMRECPKYGAKLDEMVEGFTLSFALKCFQTSFLEKKLNGLTFLDEMIVGVQNKDIYKYPTMIGSQKVCKWATKSYLFNWIKENRILESIFCKAPNPAVIAKSTKILGFLAYNLFLTNEHLQEILHAGIGQYPVISDAVYSSLGSCSLKEDQKAFILQIVRTLPESDFTPGLLHLVMQLGKMAYNSDVQLQSFEIFWRLLQEDVKPSVAENALESLLKAIIGFNMQPRNIMLTRTLNSVMDCKIVVPSIKIFLKIMEFTPATSSLDQEMNKLLFQDKIWDKLILELNHYKKCVNEKRLALSESFDIGKTIIIGQHPHLVQIQSRLDFYQFILSHSDWRDLPVEIVSQLWDALVLNALTPDERDTCLGWLAKMCGLGKSKQSLIYFFDHCMCQKLDFQSLTLPSFNCFKNSFYDINFHLGKLTRVYGLKSKRVVCGLPLAGEETAWSIVLDVSDPFVAKKATQFLIRINNKIAGGLKGVLKDIRTRFIDKCMSILQATIPHLQDKNNEVHVRRANRCIKTLKKFVLKTKDAIYEQEAPKTTIATTVQIPKPETQIQKDCVQNLSQTLGVSQMVALLALKRTYFDMERAGDLIFGSAGSEINEEAAKLEKLAEQSKEKQSNQSPSSPIPSTSILCGNQSYFNQLFSLLDTPSLDRSQVWELLTNMPTNENVLKALKMESKDEHSPPPNWNELLDSNSIYKLWYSLRIVQQFIPSQLDSQEEIADKKKWCKKFFYLGGFHHLFGFLVKGKLNQTETTTTAWKKCITLVLKIIHHFMRGNISVLPNLNSLRDSLDDEVDDSPLLLSQDTGRRLMDEVDFSKLVPTVIQVISGLAEGQKKHKGDDDDAIGEAANYVMYILVASILSRHDLLQIFYSINNLEKILLYIILHTPNARIRQEACNGFFFLCLEFLNQNQGSPFPLPHKYFLNLLLKSFPQEGEVISTADHYFDFLNKLIKLHFQIQKDKETLFNELSGVFMTSIKNSLSRATVEKYDDDPPDEVLIGYLGIILLFLKEHPSSKAELISKYGLVDELFKFLFVPLSKHSMASFDELKCKTPKSRRVAFTLLSELVKDNQALSQTAINNILPFFSNSSQSTNPTVVERKLGSYVGLVNQGSTCYMNSIMQSFFMIPRLRRNILEMKLKDNNFEDPLFQLQRLFAYLHETRKSSFNPEDFCRAFNISASQEDADEFFNRFREVIEQKSKGTLHERLIDDEFRGESVYQNICKKESQHKAESSDPFYTFSVDIKSKKTLAQALEAFIRSDTLDDGKCGTCNQLGISRRCLLDKLPNTLIVHLNRLELNYDIMQKVKIYDRFEFPRILDLFPYTKDFKNEDEAEKNTDKGADKGVEGVDKEADKGVEGVDKEADKEATMKNPLQQLEGQQLQPTQEIPEGEKPSQPEQKEKKKIDKKDYQYKLVGVIVHTGNAEAGHYYAFLRDHGEKEKWFRFDDTSVTPFNFERDLEDETFGGEEEVFSDNAGYYYLSRPTTQPKQKSAFMLFYEKLVPNAKASEIEKQSITVPPHFKEEVQEENARLLREKRLYEPEFNQFLDALFDELEKSFSSDTQVESLAQCKAELAKPTQSFTIQTFQLATNFIFYKYFLKREKEVFLRWIRRLISILEKNTTACYWMMEWMLKNKREMIWEKLLESPDDYVRSSIAQLLLAGIKVLTVYDRKDPHFNKHICYNPLFEHAADLKQKYLASKPSDEKDVPITQQIMDYIISILENTRPYWQRFAAYFWLIHQYCFIDFPERMYLVRSDILPLMLNYYMGNCAPIKPQKDRSKITGEGNISSDLTGLMRVICVLTLTTNVSDCFTKTGKYPPNALTPPAGEELPKLTSLGALHLIREDLLSSFVTSGWHNESSAEIMKVLVWEDLEKTLFFIKFFQKPTELGTISAMDNNFYHLNVFLSLGDNFQRKRIEEVLSDKVVSDYNTTRKGAEWVGMLLSKFFKVVVEKNPVVVAYFKEKKETWRAWKKLLSSNNAFSETLANAKKWKTKKKK